ncbi:MAG TPA: ethanolamine ammonia lyase-activating protein [Candidatus Binatia bacterium]
MEEKSIERPSCYDQWIESEGLPVIRDFYIEDIRGVPLKPWRRKEGLGVYLNLVGTGNVNDAYICEIPPGKNLNPERYLFEEMIYVASGHGATTIWNEGGPKQTFEWQEGSLFSPPLNAWRQHFNGSGEKPARFLSVTSAPVVMNLFHNLEFVLNAPFSFTDRYDAREGYFSGKGQSWARRIWETNFVPDVRSFPLKGWKERGAGGKNIAFELSDNTMAAHISEFPVGTYKKAHRHGAGAHVIIIGGQGYSLLWPEGSPIQRYDWHEGSIVVPPERWFHQHFNSGSSPARYLALRWGSRKNAFMTQFKVDESVKDGGDQIEYEDEDPAVRKMFEESLREEGAASKMGQFYQQS